MTSGIITGPSRAELAALTTEAAEHRESQLGGCCCPDRPCGEHEAATAMAHVLRMTALFARACDSDEEALVFIRSRSPQVLAEITGATTDEALAAAITGGGDDR